jgi:hypothetical protein
MTSLNVRGLTLARGRASVRGIALVAAAFAVQATSGCVSNEYRIQKDELRRLTELPPETRGHAVRVSQQLGARRADALDEPVGYTANDDLAVQLAVNLAFSGDDEPPGAAPPNGARGAPPATTGTPPTAGGGSAWRGTPPTTGAASTWRGTPPGATAAKERFHGAPSGGGSHPAPPSGGGRFDIPNVVGGGGGGGNPGDALVVLAVVLVVSAAFATLALAGSEGMRYEGHVDVAPDQTVHLVDESDRTREVPLGALTAQDVAGTDHALVMDDEGYGLRRLDHAPLDRHGGVFRFELGGGRFNFGDARATGLTSNIGAGYFPTSHVGLLVNLGLGSGSVDPSCCVGPAWTSDSIGRYSLGLEAQAFPLGLGPLHLGAFAGGGVALIGPSGAREAGPQATAGALLELDLTSHLALTVRGAASTAHLPGGWSSGGALTGGLAIY